MPGFGFSFKPRSTATDRSVRPTFFSCTFSRLTSSTTVPARARGSLPEFLRGRGGLGFGGCILVSLRNFLAIVGRGRRIPPARLGRPNLGVCSHFLPMFL